jgi:uncharacterized protein YjbI with pentapeptide repeats
MAKFSDLIVEGNLRADGINFGQGVNVQFERSQIKRYAVFRDALFGGYASFDDAEFGSDADFEDVEFCGRTTFDSTSIRGTAHFSRATFSDRVNFTGLKLGSAIQFAEAVFAGEADFEAMHILAEAEFLGACFKKDVSFARAKIESDAAFSFDPENEGHTTACQFQGVVSFLNIQIGGDADFERVCFEKQVEFVGAKVGGGAIFREARFSKSSRSRFDITHFQGGAIFQGGVFEDEVSFRFEKFDVEARFSGCEFKSEADFEASEFSGLAEFKRSIWEGREYSGALFNKVSFAHARFTQDARFDDTQFKGDTELREASFRVLYFSEADSPIDSASPRFQGKLDLRGCTYERIYAPWRSMLGHIEPYDRQPFVQLEQSLRVMGQDSAALEVCLERCKKERVNKRNRATDRGQPWHLRLRSVIAYCGDWLYWRGANYGVRPYQLFFFSLILVECGLVIFQVPGAAQLKSPATQAAIKSVEVKAEATCSPALSFWNAGRMSFRAFLPVDVPLLTDCEASEKYIFFIRSSDWATLFKLAGWILVPVGVAGLTGVLRRST